MSVNNIDPQSMKRAAVLIGRRLDAADLKIVLKEIDDASRGTKNVERIVVETENSGALLRTRVEDSQRAEFLVDIAGPDLLACRKLRYFLALRATEDELDRLHNFDGVAMA